MTYSPRDHIGYGQNPPHPKWPNDARIALQFVLNYEEGSEQCLLHGDSASEKFLSEIVGADERVGVRHMNIESMYEYGSRAGFWRLFRMFTDRKLPVTCYGVTTAMQKNPDAVKAMLDADWEMASHGYRWIEYQYFSKEEEREHFHKAIKLHTEITGERPLGWYTGRSSPYTRKMVAEEGGFMYNADSYADDLPYWEKHDDCKPLLIVPYTLDTNDMRFATPQGFNSGTQFYDYLKDAFDCLYAEGATSPKMLSIGLHCRLIGRPARAVALAKFLDYVSSHDQVWICRRLDIAKHWHEVHPFNTNSNQIN
ncbi:MAG: allantoinase PuuE [Gammaproteobacteria bacterium]|nr:allantoinase PuuE [Gammaproteobacteria bacterium]